MMLRIPRNNSTGGDDAGTDGDLEHFVTDEKEILFTSNDSSDHLEDWSKHLQQLRQLKGTKRTRQNLSHLTPEEKQERKRHKNRLAAQSARQRKRDNLQFLASKVDELLNQKKLLLRQMKVLQQCNQNLVDQNKLLKVHLANKQQQRQQLNQNHRVVNLNEKQFDVSSSLDALCGPFESAALIN